MLDSRLRVLTEIRHRPFNWIRKYFESFVGGALISARLNVLLRDDSEPESTGNSDQ
jgi:hypothetical protein